MINENKIHSGVWFTLPCSWDENIHRYCFCFKHGDTMFGVPSDTTNLLCKIDDISRGIVNFTKYEEKGFIQVGLKVEVVCRSGNEIEVGSGDVAKLRKLREYFHESCRHDSIFFEYDIDDFFQKSQKVFTREFRERYGLMHKDEL